MDRFHITPPGRAPGSLCRCQFQTHRYLYAFLAQLRAIISSIPGSFGCLVRLSRISSSTNNDAATHGKIATTCACFETEQDPKTDDHSFKAPRDVESWSNVSVNPTPQRQEHFPNLPKPTSLPSCGIPDHRIMSPVTRNSETVYKTNLLILAENITRSHRLRTQKCQHTLRLCSLPPSPPTPRKPT